MADQMTIEVHGLKEALDGLSQYNNFQAGGALTKALHAAGDVLYNEIHRLTPYRSLLENSGGNLKPGEMASALKKEVVLSNDLTGGYASIYFAKSVEYVVNWVEYGHIMRGHKPEKKILKGPRTPEGFVVPGGWIKKRPFMRTAADNVQERAIGAFVASLEDTLELLELKSLPTHVTNIGGSFAA